MLARDPGGLDAPVSGVHDDLHLGPDPLQLLESLDPVHPRHLLVEDDDLGILVAHDLDRVLAVPRVENVETAQVELFGQTLSEPVLVVDDQYLCPLRRACRLLFSVQPW